MYNHEPPDYVCPFCKIVKSTADLGHEDMQVEVIYHSDSTTAFLGLGRWLRNPVNVIVIPAGSQDVWH